MYTFIRAGVVDVIKKCCTVTLNAVLAAAEVFIVWVM